MAASPPYSTLLELLYKKNIANVIKFFYNIEYKEQK